MAAYIYGAAATILAIYEGANHPMEGLAVDQIDDAGQPRRAVPGGREYTPVGVGACSAELGPLTLHEFLVEVVRVATGPFVGWADEDIHYGDLHSPPTHFGWDPAFRRKDSPESVYGDWAITSPSQTREPRRAAERGSSGGSVVWHPLTDAQAGIRLGRLAWRIVEENPPPPSSSAIPSASRASSTRVRHVFGLPTRLRQAPPWFVRGVASSRSAALESIRGATDIEEVLAAVMSAHPDQVVFQYGFTHLMELDPTGVAAMALCAAWGTP
jgi:hypothetical protein